LLLAIAGCGERSLDLRLTMSADCVVSMPLGSSLLYEVLVTTPTGTSTVCGACLPVDSALTASTDVLALLQKAAPPCHAIQPGSTLTVRLNGWPQPMCPASTGGPGGTAPSLCAQSTKVASPDGRSDSSVTVPLSCSGACATMCVPLTCLAQNRYCGEAPDGCGGTLQCGVCHGNQVCMLAGDQYRCIP
jgi:hypothetical protein